jgi:two-component sensor histidine kinase
MQNILDYLFGAASFVPHGYCLLWRPDLVAIHAVSDAVTGLAYLMIPAALVIFARRRRDLAPEHLRLVALFVAFIVACALTHLINLVTLWYPVYGLQGLVKAVTAAVSLATAFAIWPLLPRLLALPSPSALTESNARLVAESAARLDLVERLQRANSELERRVRERTRALAEADQRFDIALAASNITVLSMDRELKIRWVRNPPFGLTAEEMIGRGDEDILPADTAAQLNHVKRGVLETGHPAVTEIEVTEPSRGRNWYRIHVARADTPQDGVEAPVPPGEAPEGLVCVKVNITEERRRAATLEHVTQALAEANARFDAALEGSNITMFRQDESLRYTWMYNPPRGMTVEHFLGRTDEECLPDLTARALAPAKTRVLQEGVAERLEVSMRIGDSVAWFDLRLEPLFEHGRTSGLMCVAIDITEQKEYQQQLKVVMRELTHRSKNLLAVVQGIARQTAQTVGTLPIFVDRFGARLQALARAHDLLVDESWRGASFDELVSTQLGHVIEKSDERLDASGTRVMLKPEAAQNVALALHELATNAAKYGALSTETGKVTVRWGFRSVDGKDGFEVTWTEAGGPPVEEPKRKGFGRMMIERLVPRAIDGTSDLVFDPKGIRWTLRFPDTYLVPADEPVTARRGDLALSGREAAAKA